MEIKTFYFNDLRECTYIVWDKTNECVIIDPGCHTHGHFDHIMGNAFVAKRWNIKSYIHPLDKPQLERAVSYYSMFGYNIEQPPLDTIDIVEGDILEFGESSLTVMETPGHSRGGVSLYNREHKIVITGDSLFAGSIGRTDLPGGDYEVLN